MDYNTILIAAVAGFVYAGSHYLHKNQSFDPVKFLSTVLTGAVIGIVLEFLGYALTEEAIAVQLGAYTALTAYIENTLKIIFKGKESHLKGLAVLVAFFIRKREEPVHAV